MIYSIDYYSFTLPFKFPPVISIEELKHLVISTIGKEIKIPPFDNSKIEDWSTELGSRHYHTRLRHLQTDVCISYGNVNEHLFFELAGKACNSLDSINALDDLISVTFRRTSRIDFAIDIKSEIDPRAYTLNRKSKSFKSSGENRTPSGRTSYIGSRQGERMARVYRYEPPHPRAEYLRVEAEYKGDAAKAAAEYYVAHGIQEACLAAHAPFQWTDPAWSPEAEPQGKIKYKSYRPDNASTVHWLYGDVITALSKAIKNDLVDLDDWLSKLREAGE
jgi:hypothetical protein